MTNYIVYKLSGPHNPRGTVPRDVAAYVDKAIGVYFGKTEASRFSDRLAEHQRGATPPLRVQQAIREHGFNAFHQEVVASGLSEHAAMGLEQRCINEARVQGRHVYNDT